MSLIKLKKEEMEAQVRLNVSQNGSSGLLCSWGSLRTLTAICSLNQTGEGAAAGEPAGAAASPSGGAEEAAL